jgi:hypothetical protein
MDRIARLVAVSATLAGWLWAIPASATPELFSEALKQGMPAKNCQYCHVSQVPQKESYKPDDLNGRGQWLLGQKGTQQAKDVKVDWLKQYPGGREQK